MSRAEKTDERVLQDNESTPDFPELIAHLTDSQVFAFHLLVLYEGKPFFPGRSGLHRENMEAMVVLGLVERTGEGVSATYRLSRLGNELLAYVVLFGLLNGVRGMWCP